MLCWKHSLFMTLDVHYHLFLQNFESFCMLADIILEHACLAASWPRLRILSSSLIWPLQSDGPPNYSIVVFIFLCLLFKNYLSFLFFFWAICVLCKFSLMLKFHISFSVHKNSLYNMIINYVLFVINLFPYIFS